MNKVNLLIGNGEVLVGTIPRKATGPDTKKYPYSIEQTRGRLQSKLASLQEDLAGLPPDSTPDGQGVALVTIHPAFLAKSYLPEFAFRRVGLRTLGSRPVYVLPERELRPRLKNEIQKSAALYVAGRASNFGSLKSLLLEAKTPQTNQKELRRIEDIKALTYRERIINVSDEGDDLALEVALHCDSADHALLDAFSKYVTVCGGETRLDKRIGVRGLTFLPVKISREHLTNLATFSFLRYVRSQPVLRSHRLGGTASPPASAFQLPTKPALSETLTTAILDGGLANAGFSRWVTETIAPGLETPDAEYQDHGTAVTSAFLFGTVDMDAKELEVPYTRVEHHRVIGPNDESQWYSLHDALGRMLEVLRRKEYDFLSLSIGPQVEVDDGDIHPWTSALDEYLSNGRTLAVIAAGNVPNDSPDSERIQPPSDAVNALAVGSANSETVLWDRDPSSCIGPGRSPGLVKPDGVTFAGNPATPVVLHGGEGPLYTIPGGSSFASPLTLRIAAGLRASTEFNLSATSLRALLIHHADRGPNHDWRLVGWGRFPTAIEDILLTSNSAATVIYQDHIESGQPRRARIPLPDGVTAGNITVKATFCFTAEVDPAHPINYTRSGLIITFRPRMDEKKSLPFFSSGKLYEAEQDLRNDAHKWETVLSRSNTFGALELNNPVFDIEYQDRQFGRPVEKNSHRPLPYVLIITISVDQGQNIYNKVLQKYPTLKSVQLRESVRLRA